MTKTSKKLKSGCDLIHRYRPLGLKAVLAAALQLKARVRDSNIPNA
ncbi:hypothetical protein IB238_03285 [Rhizobium sp. ARZ01]|nr:hypothetical protein [Rhizobium sp. ARZ01]MBD9371664.1 hypothetical protein [Rhizobium sp. ARZ01]